MPSEQLIETLHTKIKQKRSPVGWMLTKPGLRALGIATNTSGQSLAEDELFIEVTTAITELQNNEREKLFGLWRSEYDECIYTSAERTVRALMTFEAEERNNTLRSSLQSASQKPSPEKTNDFLNSLLSSQVG